MQIVSHFISGTWASVDLAHLLEILEPALYGTSERLVIIIRSG